MKNIFAFIILALFSTLCKAQTVNYAWANNGNSGYPNCGTPTPVNSCLSNYQLADITNPNTPIIVAASIPITALTYTLTTLPSVGNHVYGLIVQGKDQSGNTISSAPLTGSISIPSITLNPPNGPLIITATSVATITATTTSK